MEAGFLPIPLIFLFGTLSLIGVLHSCEKAGRMELKKLFCDHPYFFFFYFLQKKLFPKGEWENLFFLFSATKNLLRSLFATTAFYFLFPHYSLELAILIVLLIVFVCEFGTKILSELYPYFFLKILTPISNLFLILCSFLTLPLLALQQKMVKVKKTEGRIQDKILDFVHESELSLLLDPLDKKLITSIASFRERTAKEIMVPRIDLFALPSHISAKEGALQCISEGYSRVPVYSDHIDHIIGVLNTKDLMHLYIKCVQQNDFNPLEVPVQELISPILYTPETKIISKLLQEFRSNKIHIAIVVDEYGGTEGIVTIEDILEELVGEIADEYDVDEEILFRTLPGGGWVVDARMNILDIQKELKIDILLSPEYDTIGGYIYHKAGAIPGKGWRLHNDEFHLEVLSSTERAVEKVWIIKSE
ncbi:MAG: HlyC/CorC family transporter [Simkaniaceae bacterium]|nr:HlyC/CorC family transporter [Simkaniaceae bacterium]